jgi:hypothetical protein
VSDEPGDCAYCGRRNAGDKRFALVGHGNGVMGRPKNIGSAAGRVRRTHSCREYRQADVERLPGSLLRR